MSHTLTTPSDREIHIERIFDAPRDRVFRAHTDPALVAKWREGNEIVHTVKTRRQESWPRGSYAGSESAIQSFALNWRPELSPRPVHPPPRRSPRRTESPGMPHPRAG